MLLSEKIHLLPHYIRAVSLSRRFLTSSGSPPIIHIPSGSNIFAFGTPSKTTKPLISSIKWDVRDGEAWAIVSGTGGGGKGALFKALLGHARLAPGTREAQGEWAEMGGLYPFLANTGTDPYTRVSYVSFRQLSSGDSGAFFDYTARYGAKWEAEDRVTLRDTLEATKPAASLFDLLTQKMGLADLLDIPIITLSNGQTRRARIVKAILAQPDLLLLDEPLTGLDISSRAALTETLRNLHQNRSPRIIIGLRKGEEVPRWITHILELDQGTAYSRKVVPSDHIAHTNAPTKISERHVTGKNLLVDLKNINVVYGDRKVLNNINWEIRQGERWHLQGPNGSGKTTLLALLTGDHPQSYALPHVHLPTLGGAALRPRKSIPTAHLRRVIGVVSPEMFDAFPRRHPGMSVWEAVTTGFDGGFVPRTRGAPAELRKRGGVGWVDVAPDELTTTLEASEDVIEKLSEWRVSRCWEVLSALGPTAWNQSGEESTASFASSSFSSRSLGEQRLVLLMRALVGRPPLVLLDEAWSGMDDSMIAAARTYLRGEIPGLQGVDEQQAVVVITHWEDEVPWTGEEVRRFALGSS